MLDNITRDLADDTQRDGLLHQLTEGQRGTLGNLQAAVELLDDPDLDAPTRWPLEDMLGADFVAAAARRIEAQCGLRVSTSEVDAQLWLKVDSYSLIQALQHLAGRLAQEYGIPRVQLRLGSVSPATAGEGAGAGERVGTGGTERAQLDLVWPVQAMSTETVTAWETEPLRAGDETSALTVRQRADELIE